MSKLITSTISSLLLLTAVAYADGEPTTPNTTPPPPTTTDPGSATGTPGATAAPTKTQDLPTPRSDNDAQPEVAAPGAELPDGGIISQAGVGGVIGYGRAGVLELGGSAGLAVASNYRNIKVAPSIGWFFADNFEISAILSLENIKAGDSSATLWSTLLEPSYHLPLNRSVFVFAGAGFGASHVSGLGTGFALAPRLGMNLMVGRSGVLSPSISYQYTTISSEMTGGGGPGTTQVTTVALTSAVLFNVGYTAMW